MSVALPAPPSGRPAAVRTVTAAPSSLPWSGADVACGGPSTAAARDVGRPFFLAAMAVMLTAGAAWGAVLLGKIGELGSFSSVSVHEVNAHGHAQIMGWVALFFMGFCYQTLPRLWGTALPAPRWAAFACAAAVVGMLCRSGAMLAAGASWAAPVQRVGVGLELLAVGAFLGQLATAFRRAAPRCEPYLAFLAVALASLLAQTVVGGWHAERLMTAPDREALLYQLATFQAPLRDVQIHGMALMTIFGVGLSLFQSLFGWGPVSATRGWIAFALLATALVSEVALMLTYRLTESAAWARCLLAPWLLWPIGAAALVASWRPWPALPEPYRALPSGKFARAALLWLFASFALLLLLPAHQWASGIGFSHAYYGAIRHAITVGCVSLMIMGIAARVLPEWRGVPATHAPRLTWAFALVNLGCALRVGLQTASDWLPGTLRWMPLSGLCEWLGLALWAAALAPLLWRNSVRQGVASDWAGG